MVPGAGIEPARPLSRGILSPLRLPISPSGHVEDGHFRGLDPKDWHRVPSLPATMTV
jgi:hypothetical protein